MYDDWFHTVIPLTIVKPSAAKPEHFKELRCIFCGLITGLHQFTFVERIKKPNPKLIVGRCFGYQCPGCDTIFIPKEEKDFMLAAMASKVRSICRLPRRYH